MNDEELTAAVKESVRGAHMNIPAEQIVHRSRAIRARRRVPALAGALTAAAAATAAAVLVLTSGPGAVPGQQATAGHTRTVVTAAWTVREDAGGTVTVYLRQYANPAGLQQTLRADGVNAIIRPVTYALQADGEAYPTCMFDFTNRASPAVQRAVLTFLRQDLHPFFIIHPDAMPRGSALFLPFMANVPYGNKTSNLVMHPRVLNNDTVPACVPGTMPATPSPKAGSSQ
jgi:hypothetical protein